MNIYKKNKTATKVALMIFIILMTSTLAFAIPSNPTTYYVNGSGDAEFETIQDAVNTSVSGDTIIVEPGIYSENVYINKTLTLIANSTDPSETVILTNGTDRSVISGNSEYSPINVTINGFTIDGNGIASYGINFYDSEVITISGNVVNNATNGIYVYNNNATYIQNNIISNIESVDVYIKPTGTYVEQAGVCVTEGKIADITNNSIKDTFYGIYTRSTDFVNVTNNSIDDTLYGINVEYVNTTSIIDNEITDSNMGGIAASTMYANDYYLTTAIKIPVEDILNFEASVIENNYVNITNSFIPRVATPGPIGRQFGITTNTINASINGNTVMGAGPSTVCGIRNINMLGDFFYSIATPSSLNTIGPSDFSLPTNIEGNTVENVTIGVLSMSPEVHVIENNFNMTRMGIFSISPEMYYIGNNFNTNLMRTPSLFEGEIIDNTFDNTRTGILSFMMFNTTIQNNIINNGTWDSSGAGVAIAMGLNNTILDNTISLSPEDGSIGVVLFGNVNSKIMNNDVDGASIGLKIRYARDTEITDNTVKNVDYGILASDIPYRGFREAQDYLSFATESADISMTSMDFETRRLVSSFVNYDNMIEGNIVEDSNMYGLYLANSKNTTIYNNYFNNFNNTMLDDASNNNTVWNVTKISGTNIVGGSYLGGNYWVHPNGTGFSVDTADSNKDGICDEQYNISENEFDFLPLAPAPAPVVKKSSSGSRAYVGPSQPPEDVESTDSVVLRVTGDGRMEYNFGNSNGPVIGIGFDSREDKGVVVGNVQVLGDAPEGVGSQPDGIPYEIMSITLGPSGTISEENADNIIINFKVSWEWINENNIDLSTIRLMRFHDGQWQELPTIQISDDGEFLQFTAQTPGFSVFSIVGDEAGSAETVAAEDTTEVEVGSEEASTESTPGFTMLFSIALLAIAAVVMRRRN